MTNATPRLSIVLVAAREASDVADTFAHVRRQSIASDIEVLLVGPDDDTFTNWHDGRFNDFAAVQTLSANGEIDNVDIAAAVGIRAAAAPVVAIVEDHAYPEPGWAEAVLKAHATGDWAVVGSTVCNANPRSPLSWTNQCMAYGPYTEPTRRGKAVRVSRHNVTYKRAALEPYFDELEPLFARGGGIIERLVKDGAELYLEPDARVRHVNPSRLGSTATLRVQGGRLAAARRADREKWSLPKRLVYAAASPGIPLARGKVLLPKLWQHRRSALWLYPAVAVGLSLDAAGQALGFLRGRGPTPPRPSPRSSSTACATSPTATATTSTGSIEDATMASGTSAKQSEPEPAPEPVTSA